MASNGKKKTKGNGKKRWRVVYGIENLSGVTFVEAKDEIEASLVVKAECREVVGKTPVIYSVTPDENQ